MKAREVIAGVFLDEGGECFADCYPLHRQEMLRRADELLTVLKEQGFELKTPLDLALDYDVAFLRGLQAGGKFGIVDDPRYHTACANLENQIKEAKASKEAVPGGTACQSKEQHTPETTTKGEQQD